jgi:hypothetical protein
MAKKQKRPSYDNSVFVNCPFDDEYKPIFDAILFAIADAGFFPRCAREIADTGITRLEKILTIIEECRYGIHDISRVEASAGLPRFNMPFECGLYWGCQRFGSQRHRKKITLILDSKPNRYRKTMSDIAGQDPAIHRNRPKVAIDRVRTWLRSDSGREGIPGGDSIWKNYQQFLSDRPRMLKTLHVTMKELQRPEYYADYIALIYLWIAERDSRMRV